MAAGFASDYLRSILPKRSRMTSLGSVSVDPSDMEKYRFARAHALLERPAVLMEALHAGVLSSEQVRTYATAFPALYAKLRESVFLALVDYKSAHPRATDLPQRRDKLLGVLLQTRTFDDKLLKECQAAFAQADQGQPGKKPLGSESLKQVQTPTDRVTFK